MSTAGEKIGDEEDNTTRDNDQMGEQGEYEEAEDRWWEFSERDPDDDRYGWGQEERDNECDEQDEKAANEEGDEPPVVDEGLEEQTGKKKKKYHYLSLFYYYYYYY